MKRWSAILLVLTFLFLSGGVKTEAYTSVNFSLSFYDTLAPYGTWINVSHYGTCWRPQAAGFIPYSNGYWVYTSYGPTWVGYEPYAWSVYHYGHWVFTAEFGWVWIPGYEWSPGRVIWAGGADYIGWAPYYQGIDRSNVNLWVFINGNNFGTRNYSGVIVRRDTVRTLFDRRTVRVYSGSLQRHEIERITGRPVRVVRVQEKTILADRYRTRLVVPEGHEDILKCVSSASKSHPVEKQKVSTKTANSNDTKSNGHTSGHELKSEVKTKSGTVQSKTSGKSASESGKGKTAKSKSTHKISSKSKGHSKPH